MTNETKAADADATADAIDLRNQVGDEDAKLVPVRPALRQPYSMERDNPAAFARLARVKTTRDGEKGSSIDDPPQPPNGVIWC